MRNYSDIRDIIVYISLTVPISLTQQFCQYYFCMFIFKYVSCVLMPFLYVQN